MDKNITPIDTRAEAIRAMADALQDMGYTRDTDPDDVTEHDARYATGMMLHEIIRHQDLAFAWEFVTEHGTGETLLRFIASAMTAPSPTCDETIAHIIQQTARWYGEKFLPEALAMLPSADEIQHGQHIDQQIDERNMA